MSKQKKPGAAGTTRRKFLKSATAIAGATATSGLWTKHLYAADPIELTHWSWLAASDGEVWQKMIDSFNDAHKDKGVQIKMELVEEEQYITKVLAAVASGKGPDFGWGTAGQHAQMARDNVTVPLDDLVAKVGLDLTDFSEYSVKASRYPKYDNKMFLIPLDLMSLQPEYNLDHLKEAGLDP
ncbi:MAG TPA: extracellular solute-binding protein, partial [Candidatus Binatia bacterium]|nr:extracellular solute-binding protein [Candidatus Binatia bacterium]